MPIYLNNPYPVPCLAHAVIQRCSGIKGQHAEQDRDRDKKRAKQMCMRVFALLAAAAAAAAAVVCLNPRKQRAKSK